MLGVELLPRTLAAALRDAFDEKAAVRLSAVKDLGRHAVDAKDAAAALCRVLAEDASAEVRGAAALALADAAVRDAAPALVDAASDAQLHVRQMALIALGEIDAGSDARVKDVIRRALSDEAPAIRYQALIAAGRIEAPFAPAALLTATRDQDSEVRHVAFRILEERAMNEASSVHPSEDVRRAAERGLRDEALRVRLAAAILLGRSGDAAGASVLIEGIEQSPRDLDPEDVQAAIALAGMLPVQAAVPALTRHAFGKFGFGGDAFAYEAKIALARLGDVRAQRSIRKGLRAWTKDARTFAVVAVGRAELIEARPELEAMARDEARADPGAVTEALSLLDRARGERAV